MLFWLFLDKHPAIQWDEPMIDDPDGMAGDPRLALPEGALRDPDGHPFDVPPDGALGLLALGWVGLRLWRDKRSQGGWAPATPVRKSAETENKVPDTPPAG